MTDRWWVRCADDRVRVSRTRWMEEQAWQRR